MEGSYQHYKYYHFFALCFGLGWFIALYRPFHSLVVPLVIAVFFTLAFEFVGLACDMPAHTKKCRGPPYERRDAYWGFGFAVFIAFLNLNLSYTYTLSYGSGIIVFAMRGAKRKWNSLREIRAKEKNAQGRRW